MSSVDEIRERLAEIDIVLAADELEASMLPAQRDALVEERRRLQREYDWLPPETKETEEA
jgi:hypothetical protein